MPITIRNCGAYKGEDPNDHGSGRAYEVSIGQRTIALFKHYRRDGLSVCLEKAAEAVRLKDK